MNIRKYTFEGQWNLLDECRPNNSNRVLFTDGNSIVIGSLTIQDDTIHYMFDRNDLTGYKPIAWMELPNPIIVQKYETIVE